jgi:hypothetical protein
VGCLPTPLKATLPNRTQSRIFVPILPCSLDETIYSVDVDLPAELKAELRGYAQRDGNSWTVQAERALILYHEEFLREPDEKAKNIAWAIQQLNELVPPRPPTVCSTERALPRSQESSDSRAEN